MSFNPGDAKSIFLKALELPTASEQAEFVQKACAGQPELQARVQILLKTAHDPDSLLDQPVSEIGATQAEPRDPNSETLGFLEPCDVPGSLGQLGGYAVLEFIGRGGMGIVVRAMDSKLNRIVAIKVLAPEFAGNPQARKRFLREAQAAAAVSHDHVVTIHAVDDDQKLPFIVMECIVGQSLQQKIDKVGALTLKEILRIGMQAALGLSAAHAQGLVHRDIKPANILLENGIERVKLTDFGLARMVDDASVTQSGVIAGTPQYMSPEQARGDAIDLRSDLFSLGCVLYAMCVGHAPFRASTTMGVLKRVCEETPRPIHECNPEIPAWLVGIIDKLLAKGPDDRYQSAVEVAELLRQSLAHLQQPNQVPLPKGAHIAAAAPAARPATAAVSPAIKAQLAGPSRLLVATGILNWIGLLISIPVMAYLYSAQGAPDLGIATLVYPILAIGSALIIYGAIRMGNADSFGWSLVSTIAAMMVGPGYLIGWPAGIWSLAVLTRPDVRQAFPRNVARRSSGLRWAAACLAAVLVVVGAAWLFSPTFSLWSRNLAQLEITTGDGETAVEILRDGKTVTTKMGFGQLNLSPGFVGLRVHPKPNQNLVDVRLERLSVWPWESNVVTVKSAPHTIPIRPGDRYRVSVTLEKYDSIVAFLQSTSSMEAPAGQWTSLFNQRDLNGWKTFDQVPGDWKVTDGVLVGQGPYSFLLTDRGDYGDFHLRAEVRINGSGDSGIVVRCPFEQVLYPKSFGVKGYEAQIQSVTKSAMNTGSLAVVHHDKNWKLVAPVTDGLTPAEEWFTLEIVARGNRIIVGVNGQVTADYTDPDASLTKGHIALQDSTPETIVQFRKVEIREYGVPARLTGTPLDLNGIWDTSHPWPVEFTHWPIKPITKTVPIKGKYAAGTLGGGTIDAVLDVATRTIDGEFHSGTSGGRVHFVVLEDGDSIEGWYSWTPTGDEAPKEYRWDMRRRTKDTPAPPGVEPKKTASVPPAGESTVAWGAASPKGMQLGVGLEPRMPAYPVDELLTVKLVLRNAAAERVSFTLPRLEVLEKFGFDISAVDGNDQKMNWNWGRQHKSNAEFTVSGGMEAHLAPGGTMDLGSAKIALVGHKPPEDSIASLHVQPEQIVRLRFKLKTYGYARGEGEPLESGQVEFRIYDGAADTPSPLAAKSPFDSQQAEQLQIDWAKNLNLPVELTNTLNMKFRLIPPGKFLMGSTPEQVKSLLDNYPKLNDDAWSKDLVQQEAPQQGATIRDPYYLGVSEVTVDQFRKFVVDMSYKTVAEQTGGGLTWNVKENKWEQKPENIWSNSTNGQLPVGYLTLEDARAFCRWLIVKEQRWYQVPTDAQWEFACRAGTTTLWSFGDDPSLMAKHGWTIPHSQGTYHPSGKLAPNPFGLFDLYGNASEITVDGGDRAVERSGSSGLTAERCRSASRWIIDKPNETVMGRGFRVALSPNNLKAPDFASIDLNGSWDSRWGAVKFSHGPAAPGALSIPVKGKYYGEDGTIEGTMNFVTRTFEGRFSERSGMNGPIRLVIDAKGDKITGRYAYRNSSSTSDPTDLQNHWDMTRIAEAPTISIASSTSGKSGETFTFNFRRAPWVDALKLFAEKTHLTLDMNEVPPGTLNYYDQKSYTVAEAIDVLNRLLRPKGYALVHRENFLVLNNIDNESPKPDLPKSDSNQPSMIIAPIETREARKHQLEWARYLDVPAETTGPANLSLTLIPPGKFQMGSTLEELAKLKQELEDRSASDFDMFISQSSSPQHTVELTKPYYIGKYEVTVAQFQKFVDDTNYKSTLETNAHRFTWKQFGTEADSAKQPVCGVSWDDAKAFCQWLGGKATTDQQKVVYDLPTEVNGSSPAELAARRCGRSVTTSRIWQNMR